MGLRGLPRAASATWLRRHAVHRAERRHGIERLRCHRAAVRIVAIQSDAQSRRRSRHRDREYVAAGSGAHSCRAARRNTRRSRAPWERNWWLRSRRDSGEYVTDPQLAQLMARAQLGQLASREAMTLAFGEVFRIMAWIFLAALIMVPFCRPIMDRRR